MQPPSIGILANSKWPNQQFLNYLAKAHKNLKRLSSQLHFTINSNKIDKNLKIFMKVDHLNSQGILSQL